jgi:hypothetical protein
MSKIQADPIATFEAFRVEGRDDREYLRITGQTTGAHIFVLRLVDMDRMASALRDIILRRAKPLAAPDLGETNREINQEVDAALDGVRRLVADWRLCGVPMSTLAIAFAAELTRTIDREEGRQAAVGIFEAVASIVRDLPPAPPHGDDGWADWPPTIGSA